MAQDDMFEGVISDMSPKITGSNYQIEPLTLRQLPSEKLREAIELRKEIGERASKWLLTEEVIEDLPRTLENVTGLVEEKADRNVVAKNFMQESIVAALRFISTELMAGQNESQSGALMGITAILLPTIQYFDAVVSGQDRVIIESLFRLQPGVFAEPEREAGNPDTEASPVAVGKRGKPAPLPESPQTSEPVNNALISQLHEIRDKINDFAGRLDKLETKDVVKTTDEGVGESEVTPVKQVESSEDGKDSKEVAKDKPIVESPSVKERQDGDSKTSAIVDEQAVEKEPEARPKAFQEQQPESEVAISAERENDLSDKPESETEEKPEDAAWEAEASPAARVVEEESLPADSTKVEEGKSLEKPATAADEPRAPISAEKEDEPEDVRDLFKANDARDDESKQAPAKHKKSRRDLRISASGDLGVVPNSPKSPIPSGDSYNALYSEHVKSPK